MSERSAAASAPEGVYDPIARGTHWLNVILAVITVMLGWCISGAPRHGGARASLVTLHGSFGWRRNTIIGIPNVANSKCE